VRAPQPDTVALVVSTLAAVDVGTNSLHLVVARIIGSDRFEVLATEKQMVRLGHGGGDMKLLSPDAIARGVAALQHFRRIADVDGAPVRAVATSAVREAENHDEFLRRAREEAGVDVEVISGTEEARLIHLGVLQALPVFDTRLLLCDIGGGSTELLIGERGDVLASRSFKLGAVRLTDRFFGGTRLHPAAVDSCRRYVASAVAVFQKEVDAHGFQVAIGSSGTIESVAAMVSAAGDEPAPHSFNGFTMTIAQIDGVVDRLAGARTVATRRKVPGLDPKRADIILAGAILLQSVLHAYRVRELTVSGYALREGVLLDTIQRLRGGALHHLRDVSRRSVRLLADLCDEEPEHSRHVGELALQLFDATQTVHGLDEGCREYLEAGALLANVGLFISHSKHHLHSYYIVRNSERLAGFTDTEVEIIAQIARYHRKSAPKASHPDFARLSHADQHVVRALAGILRVAIALDRSHDGKVARVDAEMGGHGLDVLVVPRSPGLDLTLELYTADDRKGLLEDVLERPVRVVAG